MPLKKVDIAIMALCTGLIVANIYYCQPLVVLIAREFKILPGVAARITYITQAGYATGLLFLVPLGDLIERKKQILIVTCLSIISLFAAAVAHSFLLLEIASFCIGFSSIVPQLVLPLAAHLTDPANRGKIIGSIMSGLLLGILLSRTISGALGAWLGWRAVYFTAMGVCAVLLLLMIIRFPKSKPDFKGTYGQLMRSLLSLLPQPVLQEACAINALVYASFGTFWTTMVLLLSQPPFGFNSAQIGLFGLAGAAGALAAPLVGRISDKKDPRLSIFFGIIMILVSFIVFYLFHTSVAAIVAGIILLDLGIQSVHVSNQTRVYALIPQARNRLNTVYMTMSFIGVTSGSALGIWLWNFNGWAAVCIGGIALMAGALVIYAAYHKKLSPVNAAIR
jgi:predicted MFS family arabinose efflux permease